MRLICITLFIFAVNVAFAESTPFKRAADIKIGGQGGWDYLTVDEENQKLFMTHADEVDVINLTNNKVIGKIRDTKGVHGVAIASTFGKGFTSNGHDNSVTVFNIKTLRPISKIKVGENPDAILYIQEQSKIYVFNGSSKSFSVIDVKTLAVTATVTLSGKPEFAVYDPKLKAVFVNIEDKNTLVKIDAANDKVLAEYALKGCEAPSGLAVNKERSELFSVCENNVMLMTSGIDGKILATAKIGAGSDGVVYDSNRKLAISANGEGTLTVAQVDKGTFKDVTTIASEPGARTITLDTKSQRLYLPTAQLEAQKIGEHRPKPIAGTHKLLVFERN